MVLPEWEADYQDEELISPLIEDPYFNKVLEKNKPDAYGVFGDGDTSLVQHKVIGRRRNPLMAVGWRNRLLIVICFCLVLFLGGVLGLIRFW